MFEYVNARIRARFPRLFKDSVFEELLTYRSMEDLFRFFRGTRYEKFLARAQAVASGLNAYFLTLKYTFEDETQSILKFSSDEIGQMISIYLSRWDVYNIMTIIKGKHTGSPAQRIREALMPFGSIPPSKLDALVEAGSVSEVLDKIMLLNVKLPFSLSTSITRLLKEGKIVEGEMEIYQNYYTSIHRKLADFGEGADSLRKIVSMYVDLRNIVAILIMLKEGVSPSTVPYLKGGSLSTGFLNTLWASETYSDAINILKDSPYGKIIGGETAVDRIERLLERYIYETAYSFRRTDSLGIGLVIAYFSRLEVEMMNLRLIGIAVDGDLDRDVVKDYMIFLG